jgi:hypothetical protein
MKLYRYYQDYRRMGSLEGLFFLSDEEVERYKKYTGYLYWDELLGKHSEGTFLFSDDTLTVIDLPDNVIQILYDALGKVVSGPFDFDYFDEMIQERLDEEENEENE